MTGAPFLLFAALDLVDKASPNIASAIFTGCVLLGLAATFGCVSAAWDRGCGG